MGKRSAVPARHSYPVELRPVVFVRRPDPRLDLPHAPLAGQDFVREVRRAHLQDPIRFDPVGVIVSAAAIT